MLSVANKPIMLIVIYAHAECRYAECHYAECRYADCCYAESSGTFHGRKL
jgi:hypothetical protein